jgi:hypothetical protein
MNDGTAQTQANAGVAALRGLRRSPPKAIQLLLPVWGQHYVKQFLDFGLPTLLAPGNLPAVAERLPCKFVFLTSEDDMSRLREHPAYAFLNSICDVDFHLIDDLITGDNYSTTITLAYARAVHAGGADLLDTCFFFLISDYLMADGSLSSVLDRMLAGASGVLAGNFQVVAEDARKTFYDVFDTGTPDLVLAPRELMRWALTYLHPMTAANLVNFPLCHSAHSNRLFWRVDENTLIGRFYLMHMIAIRPETAEFAIGSSCDYSFIPEMCPSGNVTVLTDSDEYLVVEMQPRQHENQFLRMGPVEMAELADSLAEWTTQRHRENVHSTLVFHAAEIPDELGRIAEEANSFVERVNAQLPAQPQPYRNHPYWIGAIASHRVAAKLKKNYDHKSIDRLTRITNESWRSRIITFVHRCRLWAFGRPPQVHPWHPRWPDYQILQSVLRDFLAGHEGHILILSTVPTLFADWLGDLARKTTSWHIKRLLDVRRAEYVPLMRQFDGCLLFLDVDELDLGRLLIERIRPLLTDDGFLLVHAANGRTARVDDYFNTAVAYHADRFLSLSTWIASVQFITATQLRLSVMKELRRLNETILRQPLASLPLTLVAVPFLAGVSIACNLAALLRGMNVSRHKLYSSICMVLRPSGAEPGVPDLSPDENLYWRPNRLNAVAAKRSVAGRKSV